jgi:nitrite reductase/ring-hydroxylating ferredoxin subunit
MAEFVRIGSRSEMPEQDEAREFMVGERVICVANVGGTLSAMDNVCLHRGGPLGQGFVSSGKLICPWHGWEFNPKTGEAVQNPGSYVPVYAIKIEGDDVLVQI